MAPIIPPSRRGRHAAAPITIFSSSSSSSGSDQSDDDAPSSKTPIVLSSSSSSAASARSVVVVPPSSASRPGSAAAPRHRRPPRSPSSAVVSVRSPAVAAPAPSARASAGRGDEATSRPKRRARYRCWDVQDELKVLATLAELRTDNLGALPQASVLLKTLCGGSRALISRRCVDALELSQKVYHLKKKFLKAAGKVAATGGRRHLRRHRNKVLYEKSKEVWPELLPDAAVHQEAKPASSDAVASVCI